MDFMQLLFGLIAALGGGFFGAAIGGNFSFVITGFTVLLGLGVAAFSGGHAPDAGVASAVSGTVFGNLAFGPFTGPHVAFGGAVAGAAYAAKKGYSDSGKDIVQPLARLGKPDVLLVGALFGAVGFVLQKLFSLIPWYGSHGDSVAITVFTSALLVRMIFGANATDPQHGSSLLNPEKYGKDSKFAPRDDAGWLRFMETPAQLLPLGFFVGLLAAFSAIMLANTVPGIGGNANVFPFAISAVTIFFLNIGYNIPVTHHITNIAGLGAIMFYPIFTGQHPASAAGGFNAAVFNTTVPLNYGAAIGAVIVGGLFGVMSAFICEWGARFFYNRGTTHIDPPAFAIFISNTIVWIVALIVSGTAAA